MDERSGGNTGAQEEKSSGGGKSGGNSNSRQSWRQAPLPPMPARDFGSDGRSPKSVTPGTAMKRINALNLEPAQPKLEQDKPSVGGFIHARESKNLMSFGGLNQSRLARFDQSDPSPGRRGNSKQDAGSDAGGGKSKALNPQAKEFSFSKEAAAFTPTGHSASGQQQSSTTPAGQQAPPAPVPVEEEKPFKKFSSAHATMSLDEILEKCFERARRDKIDSHETWPNATGPTYHQVLGQPTGQPMMMPQGMGPWPGGPPQQQQQGPPQQQQQGPPQQNQGGPMGGPGPVPGPMGVPPGNMNAQPMGPPPNFGQAPMGGGPMGNNQGGQCGGHPQQGGGGGGGDGQQMQQGGPHQGMPQGFIMANMPQGQQGFAPVYFMQGQQGGQGQGGQMNNGNQQGNPQMQQGFVAGYPGGCCGGNQNMQQGQQPMVFFNQQMVGNQQMMMMVPGPMPQGGCGNQGCPGGGGGQDGGGGQMGRGPGHGGQQQQQW